MLLETEGIILAAGFSSRAGTFKMELPVSEKTLLERVIEGMTPVCPRIIVVAGYRAERISRITRGYPMVEVVFNPIYEKGMFSSVQEGVRHVRGDLFFIVPGDHPCIPQEVYRRLKEAAEKSNPGVDVFIPVFKGRKGHPVAMKRPMAAKILEEPPDSTLRTVILRNGFQLVEGEHEGILWDIDTMEDYRKLELATKAPGRQVTISFRSPTTGSSN
ncbi:MAG: molybdenum cofactor cytidylyltransferase [Acidobacteriota bacterium]|nr:molybdenum cofactor cytidylyltransferase [Acidobacteriota bacterium]